MALKTHYLWCIVGGGAAGVTAIGKLLDQGVKPESIVWVSDHFNVGDIGLRWQKVPSNTKVSVFLNYLNGTRAFQFDQIKDQYAIAAMDPNQCCYLADVYQPLKAITDRFLSIVDHAEGVVTCINQHKGLWEVSYGNNEKIITEKVILTQGAKARHLDYDHKILPLDAVFEPEKLKALKTDRPIAVFGSSHSAILAIKNLREQNIPVINFYLSPLRYALEMDGWILYDNTGLKGPVATWAKNHLHDHDNNKACLRVVSNEEMIRTYLAQCEYVIYAIGFSRRSILINGAEIKPYCHHSGIIAPGVFGLGIAYPEVVTSPVGTVEHNVGLWKFSTYLDRILPIWLRYA